MTSAARVGFLFLQAHPNTAWPPSPMSFPKVKKETGHRGTRRTLEPCVFSKHHSSPHDFGFESKIPAQSGFLTNVAQMFLSDLFLLMENG